MCLVADIKLSENFWDKEKYKGKTFAYFNKLYLISSSYKGLVSPYRKTEVKWGEFISSRRNQKIGKDAYDSQYDALLCYVYRGIHVIYTEKERWSWIRDIKNHASVAGEHIITVEVRCYKKDFVGCDGVGNAVFTKVHMSRAEYRKAMKKRREIKCV